jgi:hypothetical protein
MWSEVETCLGSRVPSAKCKVVAKSRAIQWFTIIKFIHSLLPVGIFPYKGKTVLLKRQ